MFVYRIVKTKERTKDLSRTGAYKTGGRWSSKGVYMLYTSENSSLSLLESLVHFDDEDCPPNLYIMKIEINDKAPVSLLNDKEYSTNWLQLELLKDKAIGDYLMNEKKGLGIKTKSALNSAEHNYLLNPLFPHFYDLVKVVSINAIKVDERLVR